jgi:hypothetical protein
MTPQQLLIPRYEVIADWPNNTIEIGAIATIINDYAVFETYYGVTFHYKMLDHHNHLFKKLGWWEYRSKEEMPDYLRKTDMEDSHGSPVPDVIVKVIKHFNAGNGEWRDDSVHIFCANGYVSGQNTIYHYSEWLPALESDYITL